MKKFSASHSHRPRKRFGQHFLHDSQIVSRTIQAIAPRANEHLVEIGPGLGALTKTMLMLTGSLDVIEFDHDLIPQLKQNCEAFGNLIIHQADALEFDFTQLAKDKRPLRIFGNLPYNISTPLIFHLLEQLSVIKDMHFMLQKEVAERIAAKPDTEGYGRLSVMVQYYCQVELLFSVSAKAFSPPPKVESAVIRFIPYASPPYPAKDLTKFQDVVRQAFSQRRKMLRNCLKELISVVELQQLGIDPNVRPERLSVKDFVKISNFL